ncbi:MAG: GNAT family N-acetyltransferase [Clostridia bacterium]|nr:GNAT family N-acetyltransferase [Clostridia bacterium]
MLPKIDLSSARIETERLVLRPFTDNDLIDFFAYASVPGVGEMAGWPHHENIETSRKILSMFMEEKNVLAIFHKESSRVIGSFGFHDSWANYDEKYKDFLICEIGYVLSKDYWGQGLMPEAVKAAVAYAFLTLNLDYIGVCHFTDNLQSRRVIEKSGFTPVSTGIFHAKQLNRDFEEIRYLLPRPQTISD